ncbi:enoyl-CoA hydratase/isomerase family protein [Pseudooceanicola sp. 502str34]
MIRLEKDGGFWTLTIDRPEKANSLTREMLTELADIATAAAEAQVLVITGTGKVFSAGADLDEARAGLATDPVWERLSGGVAALPGLTIAALNGTLAGGAMGMALACDLRLAVPGAKVFYPAIKLGFLPQPSDPVRMAQLIGPARTKLILMGAQKLTAEEAYAFGLIDRIVEGDVLAAAREMSADVLAADPKVTAGIKALCR